ncbi:hypothetical protein ACVWZ6_002040 [Bradyrhizobium sp. GM6.1]
MLGLLLVSGEAARHFNANGGSIINISSAASTLAPPNGAVYSATKASVDAISAVLAKELAPRKIRVNAVNPGMIVTEGVVSAGLHEGDMRNWIESTTPLGRVGKVEEIAAAVAFFASDDASYVTGETLHVAGGPSLNLLVYRRKWHALRAPFFVLGRPRSCMSCLAELGFVRTMPKRVPSPSVELPSVSAISPEHAIREGTQDGAGRQHEDTGPVRCSLVGLLSFGRRGPMQFEDFDAADVQADEARIFIRRAGSGPAVLLLHGFPQTHLMWRDVAPLLAQNFTVVCADLRGYGRSDCPPSPVRTMRHMQNEQWQTTWCPS